MYDCSKEFNIFYRKNVILSASKQNELREKRRLNIKRLKNGLRKYNIENNKNYKIAEERIQGSMAMHTITQNDDNDYDIDIGVVFESNNLDGLGAQATRNMVADALKKTTKQFIISPEVKTSCIRLRYNSFGYHMDFAIFQRYKITDKSNEYIYEHAGSEWSKRHIEGVEDWFNNKLQYWGDDLRKVIRLSKMFCKSRDSWKNMPSGLIQTILCDENLASRHHRLDEKFYYTMQSIKNRLNYHLDVSAPVDNNRPVVIREIDYKKMENFKSRLELNLKKLDILFEDNCTYEDATKAWFQFFNHFYWKELIASSNACRFTKRKANEYKDTEEFIDELYPVYEQYEVTIDCKVSGNGFSVMPIEKFLDKMPNQLNKFVPYNFSIKCRLGQTNCPHHDKILWKVLNVGNEAKRRNCIRGQIDESRGVEIKEYSNFSGPHYIECYLIKDGICVGIGHIDIPIGGI